MSLLNKYCGEIVMIFKYTTNNNDKEFFAALNKLNITRFHNRYYRNMVSHYSIFTIRITMNYDIIYFFVI